MKEQKVHDDWKLAPKGMMLTDTRQGGRPTIHIFMYRIYRYAETLTSFDIITDNFEILRLDLEEYDKEKDTNLFLSRTYDYE